MPSYIYTAKNKIGETKTGSKEANGKYELASLLRTQGLTLISAETIDEGSQGNIFKRLVQRFSKVSLTEKMIFSRHLSVMIKAGLPLTSALTVLADQTDNPKFKKIILNMEKNLREGVSFSNCLAKYPSVFSPLYISMVKVGEAGGKFSDVLKILANQMDKDHRLISRVRGAMMYPAVIVLAMIGIGIMMMIMVVPKLTQTFTEINIELPATTKIIIAISNFSKDHWLIGLISLVLFLFLLKIGLKNKKIKRIFHSAYLHLPIIAKLTRKINSARFARTTASLIESGVGMVKTLEIAAGTLGNVYFREALLDSAKSVEKGKDLSNSLSHYQDLYSPMVIQMIKVGEKTGNLSEILENLADFYEEEVDNTTKNLSSIIEPVVMVVIGVAVGFFAISMIQPMYSMMGGI